MSVLILGVSGSVSVYKACDLASKLVQAGHTVRTVMTHSAAELVSRASLSCVRVTHVP